jgi:hypothetical protein
MKWEGRTGETVESLAAIGFAAAAGIFSGQWVMMLVELRRLQGAELPASPP